MKKNLIKMFIFWIIVLGLWVLVRYTSQTFAEKGVTDLSYIINTWCIEYTTANGTVTKCDDVTIYYANEVYPVVKKQKTGWMANFVHDEIQVELWEDIQYRIDFVNHWEERIIGTVKDYLPTCVTFITGSVHGDGIANATFGSAGKQVRFEWIRLNPEQSWYMLITGKITDQIVNGTDCSLVTRYVNTWSFKSTNPAGSELFDSVVATRIGWGPELEIDKELLSTWPLSEWDLVAYKIVARNIGSWIATDVVIYDELPIQLEYVSSRITISNYTFATWTTWLTIFYIEYSGFNLNPNWIATVYLTWIVKTWHTFGTDATNCATVSASNASNKTDCVTPTPPTPPTPDEVVFDKTWNKSELYPGEKWLKFTLTVENKRSHPISNIVIEDIWPDNGDCILYSGWAWQNLQKLDGYQWKYKNWWNLPVWWKITLEIYANIANNPSCVWSYINTWKLTFAEWWPFFDTHPFIVKIGQPGDDDVVITKTVNKRYVKSWDAIKYTIKYYNNSDFTLTNYTITDIWPSGLTFSWCDTVPYRWSWNTIIREGLEALPARQHRTITIDAIVN